MDLVQTLRLMLSQYVDAHTMDAAIMDQYEETLQAELDDEAYAAVVAARQGRDKQLKEAADKAKALKGKIAQVMDAYHLDDQLYQEPEAEGYIAEFRTRGGGWDGDLLEGFALARPELNACRKEDTTYVWIGKNPRKPKATDIDALAILAEFSDPPSPEAEESLPF